MTNLTQTHPVEEVCDLILAERQEYYKSKMSPFNKQPYLYMGSISPCKRQNYYVLTEGDKRPPLDEWVQAKLESGNETEEQVRAWLGKHGFKVILAGERCVVTDKKGREIAVGKIDGKIPWTQSTDGVEKRFIIPLEIKQMQPHAWARIETVDDLFKSQWTEKYLRQLLFYLYGNGLEAGFFILDDGQNHWKLIPIYLGNHLDYVEKFLQIIEASFVAFDKKEIPDPIKDTRGCGYCNFATMCLPDKVIVGNDRIDDPEWVEHLDREFELKPAYDEYEDLHERSKDFFKENGSAVVGGKYQATVKESTKNVLKKDDIPLDLQKKLDTLKKPVQEKRVYIKKIIDKPAKQPKGKAKQSPMTQ